MEIQMLAKGIMHAGAIVIMLIGETSVVRFTEQEAACVRVLQ